MPTRHVDMQLQCGYDPVDHSSGTAIVPGDPIAQRHAANRVQRGRITRPDIPTPLKTSFVTSSQ
jgi:hypothetical protein